MDWTGTMYLGEKRSPDGLNFLDTRGLDQGLELVGLYPPLIPVHPFNRGLMRETYGDIDVVIREDESGVGDSEFGGRHFVDDGLFCFLSILCPHISPSSRKLLSKAAQGDGSGGKHLRLEICREQENQSL